MQPVPIGKTDDIYDQGRIFLVSAEARRKHMAVFGKSGVGKTTLLRNMIAWDIHHGLGLTVLDPHGNLVDDLLEMIPRQRTNDVIYFNPKDTSRALGLNMLDAPSQDQRPLAVSYLLSIFKALWGDSWGPRMEDILRNAAFALIEQPQPASLLALPKLLTNQSYRKQVLKNVSNPPVRSFFKMYDEHWPPRFREEAIAPVLNKVNAFITNPLLRAIIGQPTSSFQFRWMMDTSKIFLCDLSKGALGEDVSALLGSLIVTKLSLAALSRQDIPESQRRSHLLYADEIHNFIHGVKLPTILSEARKYRLTIILATQVISQLSPDAIDSVFGNCATIMSFRVGGDDAETLKREFATILPASQLQDLADYKLYVRTMSESQPAAPSRPTSPVALDTYPPFLRTGRESQKDYVIRTSSQRYTQSRFDIESRLRAFLTP